MSLILYHIYFYKFCENKTHWPLGFLMNSAMLGVSSLRVTGGFVEISALLNLINCTLPCWTDGESSSVSNYISGSLIVFLT